MAATDLEAMKTAWEKVARYSVYRTEGCARWGTEVKVLLHQDQALQDAKTRASEAESKLQMEPGYRPYVMSRPLIGVELENPEEARVAYSELLAVPR